MLDTWFSSQLWPFAVLGWPDDTPELRAFYPTDFLTTAREILYLWVARMIMMGLEFAGDVPFDDVYVHSVILAPDGRRMSKSLGTGIDPDRGDRRARRGRASLRADGDVVEPGRRYSHEAGRAGPRPRQQDVERVAPRAAEHRRRRARAAAGDGRGPLDRCRACSALIGEVTERIDAYDFSHAALELYSFFWSELCDWYLEMVKPRLYECDDEVRASRRRSCTCSRRRSRLRIR